MDGGDETISAADAGHATSRVGARPSPAQRKWLERGLTQPGGKLPLFDADGRKVSLQVVRKCVECGWAEPWFQNQLKPDWLVCKLTAAGRAILAQS
jgi:hypothetical protein